MPPPRRCGARIRPNTAGGCLWPLCRYVELDLDPDLTLGNARLQLDRIAGKIGAGPLPSVRFLGSIKRLIFFEIMPINQVWLIKNTVVILGLL